MNHDIHKLYQIAQKPTRIIIGLMSGTSLDGLDVALCEVTGHGPDTRISLLNFETLEYEATYQQKVKEVFAKPTGSIEKLCMLNPWIALNHAHKVNICLGKWGLTSSDIDLIASHGQTVYHCPQSQHKQSGMPNATLQIGDGDHLAYSTGIITVSDFRQKHIAAGGEGAPLVMYGEHLLYNSATENRVMLNIGGIANFTYLPKSSDIESVMCSDVGPGNTMMDAYVNKYFVGHSYDKDAKLAEQGSVCQALLSALHESDFLHQAFPKTTGPEVFNLMFLNDCIQSAELNSLNHCDILATLCQFSADCIYLGFEKMNIPKSGLCVYVSGGGAHNPLLMKMLREKSSDVVWRSTQALGIDPDAKEAMLFALLANECVAGESKLSEKRQLSQSNDSNKKKSKRREKQSSTSGIRMGKISLPN